MTMILSSASPRRLELLRQIGLEPRVDPANVDESVLSDESPEAYVERVARAKVDAVAHRHGPESVIVGADTTVVCAGEVMGKPADAADAARMLRALSGRDHEVLTAVAVRGDGRTVTGVARTRVRFIDLSEAEILAYVAGGEPLDKAGAYAIQGVASMFIDVVDGPVDNVIGLPRRLTAMLLAEVGSPLESLHPHSARRSAH